MGLPEPEVERAGGLSLREDAEDGAMDCRDVTERVLLSPPSAAPPMDFLVAAAGARVAGPPIDGRTVDVLVAVGAALDVPAIETRFDAAEELSLEFAGVPTIDVLFDAGPARLCLAPGPLVLVPGAVTPDGLGLADGGPIGLPLAGGAGFAGDRAAGGGAGSSITLTTPVGLMKSPCPAGQSKYLSPCTEPSFLPVASSSSTPIHSPV
jgi:hypothetical protein